MHEHFEHKADMGIRGTGKTREKAFEEAGKALFEVMVDLSQIKARKSVSVEAEAPNLEELFIEFLNRLLYLKDVHQMFYSAFTVEIEEKEGQFFLRGKAAGERMNPKTQDIKTEVKGATYSQLKVAEEKGEWMAQCIVDV